MAERMSSAALEADRRRWEQEAELMALNGPCSNSACQLWRAHNGPCAIPASGSATGGGDSTV